MRMILLQNSNRNSLDTNNVVQACTRLWRQGLIWAHSLFAPHSKEYLVVPASDCYFNFWVWKPIQARIGSCVVVLAPVKVLLYIAALYCSVVGMVQYRWSIHYRVPRLNEGDHLVGSTSTSMHALHTSGLHCREFLLIHSWLMLPRSDKPNIAIFYKLRTSFALRQCLEAVLHILVHTCIYLYKCTYLYISLYILVQILYILCTTFALR